MILVLAVLGLCAGVAGADVTFFPAEGYSEAAYEGLGKQVSAFLKEGHTETNACLAHGKQGMLNAMKTLSGQGPCSSALILLGAVPEEAHMATISAARTPLLVLAGDLDGVTRFSTFAAAKYKYRKYNARSALVTGELSRAESMADKLAGPIVAALKLEGSAALGTDVCNSDFPTNPACNYPQYPAFSLPPGPAPAPSPLPSADCICGSQWVTDYAFPEVSGANEAGFKLHVADAFHSVSDTHPFHLPHIWNKCPNPSGCELNVTTLTENLPGSGTLFPNGTGAPLSAYELRTKMKSRTTLYKAVGLKPSSTVDKNLTICRKANEEAWQWATQNADPSVMKRFSADGEPFVMVDDKEAPIGLHGPEWIEKALVYNRVKGSSGKSHIEVQSWTFVVGDFPIHSKYLPTGMHYCKLLSPARAMEWIYTDSLRTRRSVGGN